MRFVIDMNLSPGWTGYLEGLGHDAVHWSGVGQANATDDVILDWARENDRIVLTGDLDFGTMLAMSGAKKPSVVQLRTDATLPAHVGPLVSQAIDRAEADLLAGAILTIEAGRLRIRTIDTDRND